jgi:hypothetical protein
MFSAASLAGHGGETAEAGIPEDVIETARNIGEFKSFHSLKSIRVALITGP